MSDILIRSACGGSSTIAAVQGRPLIGPSYASERPIREDWIFPLLATGLVFPSETHNQLTESLNFTILINTCLLLCKTKKNPTHSSSQSGNHLVILCWLPPLHLVCELCLQVYSVGSCMTILKEQTCIFKFLWLRVHRQWVMVCTGGAGGPLSGGKKEYLGTETSYQPTSMSFQVSGHILGTRIKIK